MIDTLKLTLTDYTIGSNPQLTLEHSPTDLQTGEQKAVYPLFTAAGRTVEGSKAYHNGEHFNLTIKPQSASEPNAIGCYVQFSVPKIATGSNYAPVDEKATREALSAVEGHLKAIGINTNLNTASLSRIDAFKNVLGSEPYPTYHAVLSALRGQRMAKRDYGTTFLWSNTQQEICVYDKLIEMAARKVPITGLPPNTIRFEHRLLKARKVRDTLGMATVDDLLSDLGHVETSFKASLKKQLFNKSVKEVEVLTESQIEEQLRYFIERGDRYWIQSWLMAKAVKGLQVDTETILRAVCKVTNHRSTQLRIRRHLEAAQMDSMALEESFKPARTLANLYTELQTKVLS